MKQDLKILNVEYHRNGSWVCEGFTAVLFNDKETSKEWGKGICGDDFIASFITNDKGYILPESIRVINIKNFNLNFRGDHYINPLHEAMKTYCTSLKTSEQSWNAASFPDQYKTKLPAQ